VSMCGGICGNCCGFDLEAFCGVNVTEEWFTCDGVREDERDGLSFSSKLSVMEQPLVLSHLILSTLQSGCVMEQPLSPLSYLFDLINYASLILLNKLSILIHSIIVWPCGQYYKVQGWAHV